MPKTIYYLKYHVQIKGEENELVVDKKYKSMEAIMDDIGYKYCILSRGTLYRIINKLVKESYCNINIFKIKEPIPHHIIKTVVFDLPI